MLKKSQLILGSLVLALAIACAPAPAPAPDTHDADVKAIKDAEAAWVVACATKDPEKIAAFYTDDGSLLLNGMPIVTGKANVAAGWKTVTSDPNFSLTFTATRVDVAKSGELGFTQGAYTMTVSDPKTKKSVTDKGKYLTVWKKQADGSWKAVEDTAVSDGPEAPAAPAKK